VEYHILKKIVYSISKISIPRNERKQTGPNRNRFHLTSDGATFFFGLRLHAHLSLLTQKIAQRWSESLHGLADNRLSASLPSTPPPSQQVNLSTAAFNRLLWHAVADEAVVTEVLGMHNTMNRRYPRRILLSPARCRIHVQFKSWDFFPDWHCNIRFAIFLQIGIVIHCM
jgi:hypothetical protein